MKNLAVAVLLPFLCLVGGVFAQPVVLASSSPVASSFLGRYNEDPMSPLQNHDFRLVSVDPTSFKIEQVASHVQFLTDGRVMMDNFFVAHYSFPEGVLRITFRKQPGKRSVFAKDNYYHLSMVAGSTSVTLVPIDNNDVHSVYSLALTEN